VEALFHFCFLRENKALLTCAKYANILLKTLLIILINGIIKMNDLIFVKESSHERYNKRYCKAS